MSHDSLFDNFRDPHVPLVTLAIQQLGGDGVLAPMTLLVRVSGDPRGAAAAVRGQIAAMDASLPVFGASTLEESIGGLLLPQRIGSVLVGLFALLTLALSALGIYAVVAGSVARRVREIGIRLALGARPGQLRRMILAQSAAPVAAGLLIGCPSRRRGAGAGELPLRRHPDGRRHVPRGGPRLRPGGGRGRGPARAAGDPNRPHDRRAARMRGEP